MDKHYNKISIQTFENICNLLDEGKTIKLKTPFGYDKIVRYFKKYSKGYKIIFDDNTYIKCAKNHLLLGRDKELEWISADNIQVNDIVYGKDYQNYKKVIEKEELSEQEWIDFEMESQSESYIQNGLIHHNSGKSLTQTIIATYLAFKKNKKVVLIVPNVSLVKQFESDMKEYLENSNINLEDNLHIIYAGKEKHFSKPISVCTWQSIFKSEELFENVDCIIVDEVQQAKNMEGVLNDILIPYSINTKYKFGFTGSVPKGRVNELTLMGSFGNINRLVSTKDLIDMGFGTPIEIVTMMLNYPSNLGSYIRKLSYQQEKKFLNNYTKRNEYIIGLAKKVTEKLGNTLILFDNVEHGYNILEQYFKDGEFLPKITHKKLSESKKDIIYTNNISDKALKTLESFNVKNNTNKVLKSIEDFNVFFIYGDVDADDRELIRKKVEDKEKAIIIANYKTFSVGINIKNLHNLILAASTKGFERIVQSLGRTIRKMDGKFKVRIFDIVDNFSKNNSKNYGIKHYEERLNIYLEEQHPIKQKDVDFNVNIDEFLMEYCKILDIQETDEDDINLKGIF